MRLKILLTALLILFTPVNALAAGLEEQQGEALGISGLEAAAPEQARSILGELSVGEQSGFQAALDGLVSAAGESLAGIFKGGLRSCAVILIIVFLCSYISTIQEKETGYMPIAAAIAVGAVAAGDVGSLIGLGRETLYTLSDFSKVLLPSLAAAATAAGAFTSASAKYLASAMFIDILITLGTRLILPLIYAYIAAIIANAALGGEALGGVVSLMSWLCRTLLTLLVMVFSLYIAFVGLINGAADEMAVKVTKSAISGLLPVVGGIVSDAAEAVVSGAGLLRNGIGVFGLLTVAATCLIPFLTLGTHYLLYKATAGLAAAVADGRLSKLISGIGSAFGLTLGLVGTGTIMIFFSVISCMRAVTG